MANVKKTVKKPAIKSKSKVVAGGKKAKEKVIAGGKRQLRPLWQRITAAVLAFVLLGSIGSFGYYKWKENDLHAKAAARILPASFYLNVRASSLKFAICRKYNEVIGIYTKPAGFKYNVGDKDYPINYVMLFANPAAINTNPNGGIAAGSSDWFKSSDPHIAFVKLHITQGQWYQMKHYATYTGNKGKMVEINSSVWMNVNYIPDC